MDKSSDQLLFVCDCNSLIELSAGLQATVLIDPELLRKLRSGLKVLQTNILNNSVYFI